MPYDKKSPFSAWIGSSENGLFLKIYKRLELRSRATLTIIEENNIGCLLFSEKVRQTVFFLL